jgi:hypothetical protein
MRIDLKNKKNDACGAGTPAREGDAKHPSPCSADTPVRGAKATAPAERETPAPAVVSQPNASAASATVEPAASATVKPAAERQQNTAHGASRGSKPENDPAPEERKNHRDASSGNPVQDRQERELIKRAEAAIEGAERGNWHDLRTVFEFAGITEASKQAPS